MVPLRNKLSALKGVAKRFIRSANKILEERDTLFCEDPEHYKFSAFIANMSGAVECVEDSLEHWPGDKQEGEEKEAEE